MTPAGDPSAPAASLERREPQIPRSVAVASGKGGVGKTNVVANLAAAVALLGRRVLVLDADFGLSNIDVLLGLSPRHHVGHFLTGEKSLEDIVVEGPHGMRIIPAASGLPGLAPLDDDLRRRLIDGVNELRTQVDFVFIDTPAGISPNVTALLTAASRRIVMTTPEPTAIVDAYALIKVMKYATPDAPLELLVNSAESATEAKEVYGQFLDVTRRFLSVSLESFGWIARDGTLSRAVRRQKLVVLEYPSSPASESFRGLAKMLCQTEEPRAQAARGEIVLFPTRDAGGRNGRRLSEAERTSIVQSCLPLVKRLAGKLARRLPPSVDVNDLVQAGLVGLLEAMEKFVPERGVDFWSYARNRARGAMLDVLRGLDPLPRSVRRHRREVGHALSKLQTQLGRAASDEEIAETLGIDTNRLSKIYGELRNAGMGLAFLSSDQDVFERLADESAVDPLDVVHREEMSGHLARSIETLPERDRRLIALYYDEQLTMKEIGKTLGVNESRVSQLHSRAIRRLRACLTSRLGPTIEDDANARKSRGGSRDEPEMERKRRTSPLRFERRSHPSDRARAAVPAW